MDTQKKTDLTAVYRSLRAAFIISSEAFAKLRAEEQTEVLLMRIDANKPVLFMQNFSDLRSIPKLRQRLVAGEDVSMALEFNGIELSADELRAIEAVRPVLEKLGELKSNYPWLNHVAVPDTFSLNSNGIRRNGYLCGLKRAKLIWELASQVWSGQKAVGEKMSATFDGYSRTAEIETDRIVIGCQTIMRNHVEAIARHYKWEPAE